MFVMSSSRFRRAVKGRILFRLQPSQVTPTQLRTGGTVTVDRRTRGASKAF